MSTSRPTRRGLGSIGAPLGISISPAIWRDEPLPIQVPEPETKPRTIIQKVREFVSRDVEVRVEVPTIIEIPVEVTKIVRDRVPLVEYPTKNLLGELWRRFREALMRGS